MKRENESDMSRYTVTIEIVEGEVTGQMRVAYDRFWQLFIGRMINERKLRSQRPKVTTKTKK